MKNFRTNRAKTKGIYIKVSPADLAYYQKIVRETGIDRSQIVRTMLDAYGQMAGVERDELNKGISERNET